MPKVRESILVAASAERIYPIISDFEQYPVIMESIKSVNVLEKGEGYSVTEWITDVDGIKIKWTEKDIFLPEEGKIEFKILKGDLKKFDGYWAIEKHGDSSELTFYVDFELGIPMLARLLNPILVKKLRQNICAMLEDLKKKVEE
ncbi:hypothetical protein AUK11_03350 [bacterium CG2_30_37_16]|nr:MAG: hypothetical protein AUK11_03350 [bacterium CG2_30_37_16]